MTLQQTHRMKIGLFSRLGEQTVDGRTPRFNDIRELALTAKAVGFDSFWLPDHFIYRPHEPEQIGCWEVFTFLSALASTTTTIELGTLVAATSFRNPALLAKMADALDDISDGRFILGLGAGNWQAEHLAFGYPFDHRVSRFDEAMQIIAPLLRKGSVDFHGIYHQASDCLMRPRGPSPQGPPIMIGAKGERMLRIAARDADAYNMIWPIDPAEVSERWETMAAICRDVGRDPATLGLTVGTFVRMPESGRDAPAEGSISGSYEEIAATLHAFSNAGVAQTIIDFRPTTSLAAIREFIHVLELML